MERPAGEIERVENQPFGASEMIRFSTGVKVCAVSPSLCFPSMSPIFSQSTRCRLELDGRRF